MLNFTAGGAIPSPFLYAEKTNETQQQDASRYHSLLFNLLKYRKPTRCWFLDDVSLRMFASVDGGQNEQWDNCVVAQYGTTLVDKLFDCRYLDVIDGKIFLKSCRLASYRR